MESNLYKFSVWIVPLLGILITFAGVFYTRRSIKSRKLQYITYNTNLIIQKPGILGENLKITYKDKPIDVVYVTEIKFKNTGNDAISKEDIILPLGVLYEATEIYDVEVVEQNPNELSLVVTQNASDINVEFDLLNPSEYFIIQILSNRKLDYNIIGRVKNVKISKLNKSNIIYAVTSYGTLQVILVAVFLILAAVFMFIAPKFNISIELISNILTLLAIFAGGAIALLTENIMKYRIDEFGTDEGR